MKARRRAVNEGRREVTMRKTKEGGSHKGLWGQIKPGETNKQVQTAEGRQEKQRIGGKKTDN